MKTLIFTIGLLSMATVALGEEPCTPREPQKPYERPPNIFRMTPEEHKMAQDKMLNNPPPGTMRKDGTMVKPRKWCREMDDTQGVQSLNGPGSGDQPLQAIVQPGAPPSIDQEETSTLQNRSVQQQSFPMTPNDIERAAKQMDQGYEDYEATLPECSPKIKRGQVCIEKAYREKLKAERKDRERKEKGE
jgi:hypothetical protein